MVDIKTYLPTKGMVWSFILGAAAMVIVTLSTGWLTTQSVVQQKAEAARTAALVPFCVANAKNDPLWNSKDPKHSSDAFYDKSWGQDSFVENAGWATMPGSDSADSNVADACAKALEKAAPEA
jgi:hypothetical protein